ncbi:MAG: hypothetical protein ACRD2Z_13440 [Thermoanaerobaculia bacterium]
MNRQLLILDLSYFRAASTIALEKLFNDYDVAVTEELLFELLDMAVEERKLLHSKLRFLRSPSPFLPGVGHLLYLENYDRKPSAPLRQRALNQNFEVNERLADPGFQLPPEQHALFQAWRQYQAQRTRGFLDDAACVTGWCPGLKGYVANTDATVIREYQKLAAENPDEVRRVYEAMHRESPTSMPPASLVDESWTHFRRLQVRLVAALEYLRVHGDGVVANVDAKSINQWLDINHLVLGLLAGAIATGDKFIQTTFKLLRPDGILVS